MTTTCSLPCWGITTIWILRTEPVTEWLAYNCPLFTNEPPYCNTVRFITKADAVQFMRRVYPNHYKGDDETALLDFMAVNHAWEATEAANKLLSSSTP